MCWPRHSQGAQRHPCSGLYTVLILARHPQVYSTYRYTFDRVYGPDSTQQEVYENSARESVRQVLEVSHCHVVFSEGSAG